MGHFTITGSWPSYIQGNEKKTHTQKQNIRLVQFFMSVLVKINNFKLDYSKEKFN